MESENGVRKLIKKAVQYYSKKQKIKWKNKMVEIFGRNIWTQHPESSSGVIIIWSHQLQSPNKLQNLTYLFLSVPICLDLSLSVPICLYLSLSYLFLSVPICPYLSLSLFCLFLCVSVLSVPIPIWNWHTKKTR